MEVRRQFVLAGTLTIIAILTSTAHGDSSVANLFKDTARSKRQAVCSILYSPQTPAVCQGVAALSKVQFTGSNNQYVLCDPPNMHVILSCPAELPYFDGHSCTVDPLVQCGLLANPCTADRLQAHIYGFPCQNPNHYLYCEPLQLGRYILKTCSLGEVFDQNVQGCHSPVNPELTQCGFPQNPCSGVITKLACPLILSKYVECTALGTYIIHTCPSNEVFAPNSLTCVTTPHSGQPFAPPCTQENIQRGLLYHPYSADPHKYIQCDEWGGAYLKVCELNYYYNPASHTCVDGPVISLTGGNSNAPTGTIIGKCRKSKWSVLLPGRSTDKQSSYLQVHHVSFPQVNFTKWHLQVKPTSGHQKQYKECEKKATKIPLIDILLRGTTSVTNYKTTTDNRTLSQRQSPCQPVRRRLRLAR